MSHNLSLGRGYALARPDVTARRSARSTLTTYCSALNKPGPSEVSNINTQCCTTNFRGFYPSSGNVIFHLRNPRCNSQDCQLDRRRLFGGFLGVTLAAGIAPDSLAAALQPGANVFGQVKSKRTGRSPASTWRVGIPRASDRKLTWCGVCAEFIPYNAQGFALMLPSKWNPAASKGAYPGIVLK